MTEQAPALDDRSRALVDCVRATGALRLVTLSEDEEFVLGRGEWQLTAIDPWTRWVGLSTRERAARSDAALDALAARGALSRGRGTAFVRSPELELVCATRSDPAFVVEVLADGPLVAPRCYGIVVDGDLASVLVEVRHGTEHAYSLLTPELAAHRLGSWCVEAVSSKVFGRRMSTVGLLLIGRGMGADGQRIVIRDTTNGDPVEEHSASPSAPRHVTAFGTAVAAEARRARKSRTDIRKEGPR